MYKLNLKKFFIKVPLWDFLIWDNIKMISLYVYISKFVCPFLKRNTKFAPGYQQNLINVWITYIAYKYKFVKTY